MFRIFRSFGAMHNRFPLLYELGAALLRWFLVAVSCIGFALLCIDTLDGADVFVLGVVLRQNAPALYSVFPPIFWVPLIPFQGWAYFRYMVVPLGALIMILIYSAHYVKDIYHLQRMRDALRFVVCSLFALAYPTIVVDSGRVNGYDLEDERQAQNLLKAIGGPGFVRIQPGNAVAFRHWREIFEVQTTGLYFMRPFEMIAAVVSLEDQHGHIDESPAVTRDGIRLRLRNIDYQFRVKSDEKTAPRNQRTPYPFSTAAVQDIAYSFAVTDSGLPQPWHAAVRRSVNSALGAFISTHELDYLTAPRQNGQNPRRELRVELFSPVVQKELRKWGAELHWIDIGHFDFDDLGAETRQDAVDSTRAKLWAVKWAGEAKTALSYADAIHLAYQELGRAEAQAEMIMSITDSLRNTQFGADRVENLRQIFLARTAQILAALRDSGTKHERFP